MLPLRTMPIYVAVVHHANAMSPLCTMPIYVAVVHHANATMPSRTMPTARTNVTQTPTMPIPSTAD